MVIEMLRGRGNLMKVTPHTSQVGYSQRGGVRVQTIVSTQWFVDSKKLSEKVMAGWAKKEFEIVPARYGDIFEGLMTNLHEWCISRQLWWGHQIPAYYDKTTGDLIGVTDDPSKLIKKYGKDNVVRDEDVLDTWFSSALWPFAVLDWDFEKEKSKLFKKFYPAQVLETGHDILLFWVVRMLLFGYALTDETPFKTVYLHGLVTDDQGRKFSKSLGNGIDPIEVIGKYSADALRLSLIIGNTPGNNLRFSLDVVKNNQTFLNKLWNVARFVWMNAGEGKGTETDTEKLEKTLTKNWSKLLDYERWILTRLKRTAMDVTKGMEEYDFGVVGEKLVSFTRDEFADYAIECFKLSKESSKHGQEVMMYTVLTLLKLWHPYIPFVTEALNGIITGKEQKKKPIKTKKGSKKIDEET
jgi:valyl-tRNA synthetase